MAMAQAAYSNNASTIFQGRNDRYIDDVLAAPIHNWQVNVGYLVGGAFRATIIGVGLAACAIPITGAPVIHPALLILAVLMLVVGFGALGTIVGIYAETFDHTSFINNIVILPLTFLGGVFYSVSRLGSPWEQLSHVNPLFYVVETIRYGFLGVSDVSPWISFGVVAGDVPGAAGVESVAVYEWAEVEALRTAVCHAPRCWGVEAIPADVSLDAERALRRRRGLRLLRGVGLGQRHAGDLVGLGLVERLVLQ